MGVEAAPQAELRFPALDILRLLCAIAVVCYHFGYVMPVQFGALPADYALLPSVVVYGHWAVQIFFVISGFVIALSSRGRRAEQFLWARFLRVFPTYWICVCIAALAALSWPNGRPVSLRDFGMSMAMLSGHGGSAVIDTVYWTLAIEIKFYFLMAVAILLGWHRNLTVLAGAWLGACGIALVAPGIFGRVLMTDWIPYFLVGIFIYELIDKRMRPLKAALLAVATAWSLRKVWMDALANPASGSVYQSPVVSVAVVGFGMAFVLFAAFGLRNVKWRDKAMTLGGLTYPLYLLHNRAGEAVMGLADRIFHAPRLIQGLAFCLVIAGAFVVAQVLEPPFRKSIRKLWTPAPRAVTQSQGPGGEPPHSIRPIAARHLKSLSCHGTAVDRPRARRQPGRP